MNIRWFFFTLLSRLKGEALPREVNRYALIVRGKKLFQDWAGGLRHPLRPPVEAKGYSKTFLLPYEMDSRRDPEYFGEALYFILLDVFSDFASRKEDVPNMTPVLIERWFEFEKIDAVVDYSGSRLQARAYQV